MLTGRLVRCRKRDWILGDNDGRLFGDGLLMTGTGLVGSRFFFFWGGRLGGVAVFGGFERGVVPGS